MTAPVIKFGGSAGGGKSIRAQAVAHLADRDQAALVVDGKSVMTSELDGQPRNKRTVSKEVTRLRVLAAARFMFAEIGYADTTIRDLAKRIGMSTGAVFATVPDKETLWTEAMGGPPPSPHLADEVALLLAQLPGWRFLFKHDGTGWFAQLNSPCYSPERGTGQIYLAPNAASPAAALRKVRLDCLAFNAADQGRGH